MRSTAPHYAVLLLTVSLYKQLREGLCQSGHDVELLAHFVLELRCYPIVKGESRTGDQTIADSEGSWSWNWKVGEMVLGHSEQDRSWKFFLIGIVEGGVQVGPLGTAATNRPIVPAPGDYGDREIGGMIGRGIRSTRRKPAPVPLCPPQTPQAARTTNPALRGGKPASSRLSYGTA
jgi:hypothetical protein